VNRFKGERVVHGMACFIEGRSSIDGPAKDAELDTTTNAQVSRNKKHPPRPSITTRNSFRRQAMATHGQHAGSPPPDTADSTTRVFERAAKILLESTFADGAVIFAAAPETRLQVPGVPMPIPPARTPGSPTFTGPSPGSDSLGYETSDSDTSPSAKPCRIAALSVVDKETQNKLPPDASLSLGTLDRYCQLFPQGETFFFTGVYIEQKITSA
jgi:hypothetical protein